MVGTLYKVGQNKVWKRTYSKFMNLALPGWTLKNNMSNWCHPQVKILFLLLLHSVKIKNFSATQQNLRDSKLRGIQRSIQDEVDFNNFCQLIMTLKFLNFHTVLWPERPNYWLVGLFGPQVPRARAGSNTEISGSGFIGLF